MNFQISVVSLTGTIYEGEAKSVTLPSVTGQMTVFARHMPLVAPLTVGEVVLTTDKETKSYAIGKGVFSIAANKARLLIEDVASADDISEEKAAEAKKLAEDLIAKGVEGEELVSAQNMLRRSLIDLKIASKRRRKSPPIS